MPEPHSSEPIDLGFSVADASQPSLHLDDQVLIVRFTDWRERQVNLTCRDVVAVRWQEAGRYIDDRDHYDGTVVVRNSEWLAQHDQQGDVIFGDQPFTHLKLNFNAAGILEVLCTTTGVELDE